ncbi:hypothetical protein NP493_416g02034 [Ridgeia piscesae]|uniref:Uncharacterized protein n=1 Tax=Ridgeia piscesae TaxID=27915 RepID=A0AAD9L1G9_RIDPI|nr:hypothetical protein NP493_416g02034 [Ridgeia piscesae]
MTDCSHLIQTILDTGRIPGSLSQFLEMSPSDTTATGSTDSLDKLGSGDTSTHQPVIGFTEDVFLEGGLTDIITGSVTHALYGSTDDLI